ncbi:MULTISPECIES: pilus assembly protein TadG-related protein [unclassified Streptomyces]|uniref:pilus assembly protein TadG-related protein n=1 Tax=unclassified Streptomyces TaxID=2593676 RepID=UPI0009985FD8|nr:pilus assembly protein TadG-related protein [Streptomyces sp. NRRL F-5630]
MPLFIWASGAILFAAFVLYVFAQAAVLRNSAQSAADAAALAAAQGERDELVHGLVDAVADDGDWVRWLTGQAHSPARSQAAAERLAAANGASVLGLQAVEVRGFPGFEAHVRTTTTIGATLVPGTAGKHASARATAVVRPRCQVDPEADPPEEIRFTCAHGESFDFDPGTFDPVDLPDASVLFAVSLAD